MSDTARNICTPNLENAQQNGNDIQPSKLQVPSSSLGAPTKSPLGINESLDTQEPSEALNHGFSHADASIVSTKCEAVSITGRGATRESRQLGYLFQDKGSWRGKYRKSGCKKQTCVTLGKIATTTESEARSALQRIVDAVPSHQLVTNSAYILDSGVVEISDRRGRKILVDAADYPTVEPYRWCTRRARGTYYAVGHRPGGKSISMHRLLLGFPEALVDHQDGNGLNNRRENIRTCTPTESMRNRSAKNKYGFKGIAFISAKRLWRASISDGERRISLGCFRAAEDAARAYDEAAKIYHGPFARLNFPEAS